jgi:hypothetical protein
MNAAREGEWWKGGGVIGKQRERKIVLRSMHIQCVLHSCTRRILEIHFIFLVLLWVTVRSTYGITLDNIGQNLVITMLAWKYFSEDCPFHEEQATTVRLLHDCVQALKRFKGGRRWFHNPISILLKENRLKIHFGNQREIYIMLFGFLVFDLVLPLSLLHF